ncbi:MAG: chemotaxis protein [Shinella sp.]|nr:chemotaxis protein [Shinella sp.]
MAGRTNIAYDPLPFGGNDLVSRLEGARSQIEQRFLDGGAILLSVLDVLNTLLSTLENLAKSLDEDTAKSTIDRLGETVAQLSVLPDFEEDRQQQLASVARTEQSLGGYVADMQETLRYLRTFATTAKITGAGIQDFSGFAEEIIERIQFGAGQVNQLSDKIVALGSTLGIASARGSKTLEGYRRTVPEIVENLTRNADALMAQRRHLAELAEKVSGLTRKVQMKVGTTLSAMQIGDITRQRIEHCQSAFRVLDEYLDTAEGRALAAQDRSRLSTIVHHLVFEQLTQITADFDRDCTTIVKTIVGFNSDIAGLLALHAEMEPAKGQASDSAMRVLEADVAAARRVVGDIEKAAREANELSHGTLTTVRELLQGIETIKLVRTDIQYMALNTNLRCSRLGEEGRAINVVTAELRGFSSKLDETAERILQELQALQADAAKLGETAAQTASEESLDGKLEAALSSIREVGNRMEEDMKTLNACSQDVAGKVTASMAKLDYKAELGDVLSRCAQEAAELAESPLPGFDGLEIAITEIGGRIARCYTMVSEREVHAGIFGSSDGAPAAERKAADENLFEDALF